MKRSILIVTLIAFINIVNAQQYLISDLDKNKIKVYMLGTFHFAQTDSTYNVMDQQHQKSLDTINNIIANQNPNKVFVERQPEYEFQNNFRENFQKYKKQEFELPKNEVYQIGFKVAKLLNHDNVYSCDHPGMYRAFYQPAFEYAENNNQLDLLEGKKIGSVMRYEDYINSDSIRQTMSLLKYLQWENSDTFLRAIQASYNANFSLIGSSDFYNYDDEETLIGANLISEWYRRNIMIYTKIVNQVDFANDESIFIVIGGDHVPILAELLNSNPYFEVVKADEWLQSK